MSTSTINIRMDSKIKKEAQELSKKFGTTLSAVANMYFTQFVRDKSLNFSLRDENGFTPEQSAQILKNWKDPKNTAAGNYKNKTELKRGLESLKGRKVSKK